MGQWRLAWLRFYYWATLVFFLLDTVWGVSVRAAFLPGAELRLGYYAFCLGCAWLCQRRSDWAHLVGMGESAVNVFLVILSVMLPLYALPVEFLAGGEVENVFTLSKLVNVMLSGTMLVVSFHRNQAVVTRMYGPFRSPHQSR